MKLFRITTNIFSLVALIIANCIPLYGVLYWGWQVFSIMLLYWTESAIIGFFTLIKMRRAEGDLLQSPPVFRNATFVVNGKSFPVAQTAGKAFFIPFFTIHYGLFMFVHLIFLLAFFFQSSIDWFGVLIGFLGLCSSHAASYYGNFIGRGEYKVVSAAGLFFSPYPRVIVMHLTIIIGGAFAFSAEGSHMPLVLMIIFKTIVDLISHLVEHTLIQKKIIYAKN